MNTFGRTEEAILKVLETQQSFLKELVLEQVKQLQETRQKLLEQLVLEQTKQLQHIQDLITKQINKSVEEVRTLFRLQTSDQSVQTDNFINNGQKEKQTQTENEQSEWEQRRYLKKQKEHNGDVYKRIILQITVKKKNRRKRKMSRVSGSKEDTLKSKRSIMEMCMSANKGTKNLRRHSLNRIEKVSRTTKKKTQIAMKKLWISPARRKENCYLKAKRKKLWTYLVWIVQNKRSKHQTIPQYLKIHKLYTKDLFKEYKKLNLTQYVRRLY
eukprot:TRINITY_DN4079_c0_g1_i3.p1 TRINITY_DN4079_c0_g1~~TRINITY_DN4079_c0_g1_i3.p1  ORF type:complete len:270 (-),score=22.81 TRINITY_DN4079_c0_g1_i3:968-1777(-)